MKALLILIIIRINSCFLLKLSYYMTVSYIWFFLVRKSISKEATMYEDNMDKIGYRVIVSGRVQGVGFRYFTAKEADKLSICGYAKNLLDGSVEVLIFGSTAQLSILLKWLENGPKTSIVSAIEVTQIAYIHKEDFLCL